MGGNGSTPFELNWYQDRFQNQPDADWAISMSLTAYRTMMLAWSLWLAFSLLGWIRWGWRRLVETGYVGQHPDGTPGGTGGTKGSDGPHGSGAPGVPGDTKGTDGGSSALSRGRTTATNAAAASHAVARRDAAPEKVAGPDRSTRQDSVAPDGSVNVAGSTRDVVACYASFNLHIVLHLFIRGCLRCDDIGVVLLQLANGNHFCFFNARITIRLAVVGVVPILVHTANEGCTRVNFCFKT